MIIIINKVCVPGQKVTGLYVGPKAQSTSINVAGQPVLGGGAGMIPAQGGPLANACQYHHGFKE